mgnify:CR=1 FL=1
MEIAVCKITKEILNDNKSDVYSFKKDFMKNMALTEQILRLI